MLKKLCVCALALALIGTVRRSNAGEQKMPTAEQMKEIQEIMAKQQKRQAAADESKTRLLRKSPLITTTDKDSLCLSGYGFPSTDFSRMNVRELQCQSGMLYVGSTNDFNQRYYYFAFDSARTFAQALKQEQEDLAPYFAMKSLTPDLRQRLQTQVDILRQAHSPADLEYGKAVQIYGGQLIGNAALTQAQMSKLSSFYGQKQQMSEDLQKLVAARDKAPAEAALEAKLVKACEKYFDFERTGVNPDDFYSPAQRHALGLDAGAAGGHHHGVTASASASAGMSDADAEKLASKMEQEQNARVKKHHDEAKIKFTLKGKDAGSIQFGFQIPKGTLYIYMDALPDNAGANFVFYVEESETWEAQKVKWIAGYDLSKPDQKAQVDAIKQATSSNAYQWSRPVAALRAKQTVPPEVEQHLSAMIKEWDDAAGAVQKAYDAALAKPADPALQRALFEAVRDAYRIEQRNGALARHDDYFNHDESAPWLLTTEQMDIVNAGQLCTSSEMSSGSDGHSIAISARPAGDKQYVGISASNVTVGSVAESVEHAAQRYFHNHKLKLTLDPAASDKPLKGMVEGKSADELLKSFAQRAGLNLVKDEKTDSYTLKL